MIRREYVSDMSALCGAERLCYTEGKAKGVEIVRVYNGKLNFDIVLDRCMDIYRLEYKGMPVSYFSKNGLISARLTGSAAYPYESSFDGGFMYTCGLDNIGSPAKLNGKDCIQHGSVSYIPAENVNVVCGFEGEDYYVTVTGVMKYTALFGSRLIIKRSIRVKYLGNELELKDEIVNENYVDDGYMIQYHTNFGYPVLNENTKLFADVSFTEGTTPGADTTRCFVFSKPIPGCAEQCFMHTLNHGGKVQASVEGENLSIDLVFDTKVQPYMLEWKYMACGDYVLGLEPASTRASRKEYTTIKPFETKKHGVKYIFREKNGA